MIEYSYSYFPLFFFQIPQKFSKDVEKLLGPKGNKLFEKRKQKSFLQQVDDLAAAMRGFQKEPGNLKEYSSWLSGFKADTFSNELEIPGQPRVPHHQLSHFSHRRHLFDELVNEVFEFKLEPRLTTGCSFSICTQSNRGVDDKVTIANLKNIYIFSP